MSNFRDAAAEFYGYTVTSTISIKPYGLESLYITVSKQFKDKGYRFTRSDYVDIMDSLIHSSLCNYPGIATLSDELSLSYSLIPVDELYKTLCSMNIAMNKDIDAYGIIVCDISESTTGDQPYMGYSNSILYEDIQKLNFDGTTIDEDDASIDILLQFNTFSKTVARYGK